MIRNKGFRQSLRKSGSSKKEVAVVGLEELRLVSLWIEMRMGDERSKWCKEGTNLTRLQSCCCYCATNFEVENEDERESACQVVREESQMVISESEKKTDANRVARVARGVA